MFCYRRLRYDCRAHFFHRSDFLITTPGQSVSWKHPDAELERQLEEERFGDARADVIERRQAEGK